MARLEEYEWWLINELVFRIHTSKNEMSLQKLTLEWLKRLITFDQASFYICENKDNDLIYSSPVFLDFDKKSLEIYISKAADIDFNKWMFFNRRTPAYREEDVVSIDKLKLSQIYKVFYEPCNITRACKKFLIYEGKLVGVIGLYRKGEGALPFSETDLYILDQLSDHLSYKLLYLKNPQMRSTADICDDFGNRYALTKQEVNILRMLASNQDTVDIAETLCISPNTLKKHLSNIYKKSNVNGKNQLIKTLYDMVNNED